MAKAFHIKWQKTFQICKCIYFAISTVAITDEMDSGGMWQSGQPNSDTEHCVSYYHIATFTHKWFDRPCSESIKSICQVKCKSKGGVLYLVFSS